VSASEKLKALDEALDTQHFLATLNYYIGPGARTAVSRESMQEYRDVKAALVALPHIVAVVEAAESVTSADQGAWHGSRLLLALAALDEALS